MNQAEIEEMESLVEKLDGIIAARFVSDSEGKLEELHVLSDKAKSPKQLSRDIQSAVSAAMGYNISHNIISIAQISGESTVKTQTRLKISGLDISYSKNQFIAHVTLEIGDEIFKGTAESISNAGSRTVEVARACINAINTYLKYEVFHPYDIQKVRIGDYYTAVVAVSYYDSAKNEKILTGTSIIKEDEYYSAIKATLDAVNRILPQLTVQ
jgi:hypothetical protein